LFPPPAGCLPEAEIHARLAEALGAVGPADLAPLREAAERGLEAYAAAFLQHVLPDPRLTHQAPVLLYRTLPIAEAQREGAVLLGLTFKLAMEQGASVARAGFQGSPMEVALGLFEAILKSPSGLVFAVDEWEGVLGRVATSDGKVHLALPDLLEVF